MNIFGVFLKGLCGHVIRLIFMRETFSSFQCHALQYIKGKITKMKNNRRSQG